MSDHPHQDWEPVVLRKTKTTKELVKEGSDKVNTVRRSTSNTHAKSVPAKKKDFDFDPANATKIAVSNHDLALAIQNARKDKSMTQQQLDNACNFAKNTTRDYENGTAVVSINQIVLMDRILGTKLPRPTKK